MLKDITLGQYFPGNSPLHRCDPRIKLIITVMYIITIFLAKSWAAYGFMLLFTLALIFVSTIPFKMVFRGFRAIIFIMAFTAALNIFWTKGETLLFEWRFIHIYLEGIFYALQMILRLICLVAGSSLLLSYTTSPIGLTDAIERLFSPLKLIKVPVHEFAMMMTIALRFIPTLVEETDKIMSAQKARGANFTEGSLVKRAKALVPILIPLFISAFRRADELATAMECRCYRGGEGRTSMNVPKIKAFDILVLFVFIIFTAGIIGLNLL